jgi:NADPH:quinone reductase-like Zn-dependent oxidoreductase
MKAWTCERYGSAGDVLELQEIDPPEVPDDGVLVRVRAASLNPVDWHSLTGKPLLVRAAAGLRRPRSTRVGTDFAGMVESVGASVTRFRPGDDVFGLRDGALAEQICVAEDKPIVHKPANVSFEQAGCAGVAAVTALQGVRDKGGLQAGQKVLVNGASGGVGTFTVQIAKAFGADVTGVCSTRNVELVRALGADRVLDYTQEDFTRTGDRYDLILDNAGNRSWPELTRVLAEAGTLVTVGAPKGGLVLGGLGHAFATQLRSIGSQRTAKFFIARPNAADLEVLAGLMESGQVVPSIDRQYPLDQVPEAFDYLGTWHARAKIVVTI